MRLKVYERTSLNFQEIDDLVNSYLFKDKKPEELVGLYRRVGFCRNEDSSIGDRTVTTFHIRHDCRKLPSGVKNEVLSRPDVKKLIKGAKNKKEASAIQEEILHKAQLKMPWSSVKCRIVLIDQYAFIIDAFKEAEEILQKAKLIGEPIHFKPNECMKGLVDKETGILIDICRGSYKYDVDNAKHSISGELTSKDEGEFTKVTLFASKQEFKMKVVVTDKTLSVERKEMFGGVEADCLEAAIEGSFNRFIEIVLKPLMKLSVDEDAEVKEVGEQGL